MVARVEDIKELADMLLTTKTLQNLCFSQSIEEYAISIVESINFALLYGNSSCIFSNYDGQLIPIVVCEDCWNICKYLQRLFLFFAEI